MPITVMNYIEIIGVIAGVIAAYAAWRSRPNKTKNVAINSQRVDQEGGAGTTANIAKGSQDVRQKG